jgi:protein pelota
MKLVNKYITEEEGGHVTLIIQDSEDLWHAYNLILPGDTISTKTTRKVSKETASGSNESEKVKMRLSIRVLKIDFDPMDDRLRLSGVVNEENRWVKMGSHHTLELDVYKQFRLTKEHWDEVTKERLEEACSEKTRASAAAVVMQEGVANVCLLTDAMTLTKAHITQAIPRKRKTSSNSHDKSVDKFYQVVYDSLVRIVDFSTVKAVIIASPGFVKDQFYAFLTQAASKSENKAILENKSKFLLVHSSSGHRHALNEILREPAVIATLADTKAASEVAILAKFNLMMAKDMAQVVYSKRHVFHADESGAIEDLLLSDSLFRAKSIALRAEFVGLVDSVKAKGGRVHIFSSLHVSGEQLAQYSGIAAILRFPLHDIDDIGVDETEDLDLDQLELDPNDPSLSQDSAQASSSIEVPYDEEDDE